MDPHILMACSLVILDCALVTIGNRVMFGPFVSIFSATHETEVQSRRDYIEYAIGVKIGDDCWIGGNCTILAGVTIGEGTTIGAGSVVTKSIPPGVVAVGNPARVLRNVSQVPEEKLPPGYSRVMNDIWDARLRARQEADAMRDVEARQEGGNS